MELSSQMVLFARVVDSGSFSSASRELHQSPSAVSKQISSLENEIGIRLLTRSSRGISLTDEGRVFYHRCAEIRRNVASALDLADSLIDHPQGLLHVATTVAFGKSQLLPALPNFLDANPEIEIDLEFNDRPIDVSETPVDVAIQFAEQIEDQGLIGKKLAVNRRIICASPSYVSRYGRPKGPAELASHNFLRLSTVEKWNDWVDEVCGNDNRATTQSNFTANSTDAIYHAAMAGLGVARLPTYLIAEDLATGRLINLLPELEDSSSNIYAVYSMRRNMSPKVRVFLNYLGTQFADEPWEHGQQAA